jgi:NHL repeat
MTRAQTLTRAGLATLVVCALTAAPAGAHVVRSVSSFTPTGVEEPAGVAVEQATGDVYVAGEGSGNVEKFSATGTLVASFVSPELEGPVDVAVDNSCYQHKPEPLTGAACSSFDPSNGDVYVTEHSARTVLKLGPSGEEVAGFTPITSSSIPPGKVGNESFRPVGVAVDPSNGNVIVEDGRNSEVDIFSSSGAFISQFSVENVNGIAVGSSSEIFTATRGEGAREWSPTDGYSTPTQIGPPGGLDQGIAADLSSGDILVNEIGEPHNIEEYEASGTHALLEQFGSGLTESLAGVAVDEASDTVYATATVADLVAVFGAPKALAEVVTGSPATGVTATAAEVSGMVNPWGVPVTGCRFEYGLSTSYGDTAPCEQGPGSGTGAVPVTASLAVHPDETYHYRLAAVNAIGAAYGADETFQTEAPQPTLQSESVSAVTQTTATLNATINPNDQETPYHFEYGTTTAYGTVLPVPSASAGSGYGPVNVGQELSGLQPATTYHFRVVASNGSSPAGGTVGPDQTFTTPPPLAPVVGSGQAVDVGQSTATLTGTVDTEGFQTQYEFDLGTDTGYGTRIFGNAGSEPGVQTFTVALQDLMPGRTYHYRIAATNTFGTVYGVDVTFTTGTYPSATLAEPVTPALVPAILLAPEVGTSKGAGRAASVKVKAVVRAARRRGRTGRRNGGGRLGARRLKGRAGRVNGVKGRSR